MEYDPEGGLSVGGLVDFLVGLVGEYMGPPSLVILLGRIGHG